MVSKRTRHGSKFKAKVALEALKGDKTLSELSKTFEVHSSQISQWRGELARGAELLFERDGLQRRGRCEVKDNELYEEIGRLKVQLEFFAYSHKIGHHSQKERPPFA